VDPPLLLIEDNPADAALIQILLRREGDALCWVDRLSSGLEIIRNQQVSEVLVDLNLPDSNGMSTLATIRSAAPDLPVVVITGADDPGMAQEAMRAGATDYLVKGRFDADTILRVVRLAREQGEAARHCIFVENRTRAIVDALQEGLAVLDENAVLTLVNRALAGYLQRSPGELLGTSLFDYLDPRNATIVRRHLKRPPVGRKHRDDVSIVRPDGTTVTCSVCASPLFNADGAFAGSAITLIAKKTALPGTGSVGTEQSLRLSSLGSMAAEVAHEFNNVLMGIQPVAEVIERTSSDERIRKAATQIERSVLRGKTVAEDILRFTSPKPPALVPLAVAPWLETVIEPELRVLLNHKIDLIVEVAPDLWVLADPTQIAQVLVNLTMNAKHAMPKGGQLRIRVRRCGPGERFAFGVLPASERFVQFEITDTGSGMNQATLEHVFEPRFTTKTRGSGLGLSLTQQILQRHGGHVFAESTPGAGTTFHLFLVAADQTIAPADGASGAEVPTRRPRRVLIVDDEIEIAVGLKELLALEEIECEVVYDAQAVLPAIERFAPDVVVLDVTLGEASGFDVYATIAERWPDLGVIFSTGHATEEQLESLPRGRYVALLRKPYDFARLMTELGKAMM